MIRGGTLPQQLCKVTAGYVHGVTCINIKIMYQVNSLYDWSPNHLYILYSAQKKLAEELRQAVDELDVIKVRSLLGQGADPNHQLYWSDEWRWKKPPLHLACYQGYLEIAKTLVTHGACTDKGGGMGVTTLHWACWGGHKEMVQCLIQELKCSTGKQSCINKIMFLRI